MERFRRWFAWKGGSQLALAQLLGCSQGKVSKLLLGKQRPGRDLALSIERESAGWPKGPIRAEEWGASRVVKRPRGEARAAGAS